jgi:endonuclease YncB( thermonuclease family)
LLQVGDRNRTYTVELACVAVEEAQQTEAIDWLRQQLPRRRRVNLRPVGSSYGQLVARVTPLGEDGDLNDGLIAAGLATDRCSAELG